MSKDAEDTNHNRPVLRRRRPNTAEESNNGSRNPRDNGDGGDGKLRILTPNERCNFLRSRDDVRMFLSRIIRWRLVGRINNQDLRALHVATTNVLKSMGDKNIEEIETRLDRLEQLLRPRLVNAR